MAYCKEITYVTIKVIIAGGKSHKGTEPTLVFLKLSGNGKPGFPSICQEPMLS